MKNQENSLHPDLTKLSGESTDKSKTESPSSETKKSRQEILREFQSLPDANPNQTEESAWIELEMEADAAQESRTFEICWQRSVHVMPRIRIVTEFEEHIVPWGHITLIKADRSRKIIEIFTSIGFLFTVASRERQDLLFALLQLERVKAIYPIPGVKVRAEVQQTE